LLIYHNPASTRALGGGRSRRRIRRRRIAKRAEREKFSRLKLQQVIGITQRSVSFTASGGNPASFHSFIHTHPPSKFIDFSRVP
jgi:hypothetical protein